MSNRDLLRLLNLLIGLFNIYLWSLSGYVFNFIIGCLNIGVFTFGKK